jgi:hypothetical protein
MHATGVVTAHVFLVGLSNVGGDAYIYAYNDANGTTHGGLRTPILQGENIKEVFFQLDSPGGAAAAAGMIVQYS